MDVRALMPKDKFDDSGIADLKKLSFDDVKDMIPDLLVWLQDMNWPVAFSVAEVLRPFTDKITPQIVDILRSNDEMWVYWILNNIARYSSDPLVVAEIERIRKFPTKGEIENGIDELATEILLELDTRGLDQKIDKVVAELGCNK
ncbi:DUF5071 domain-containing protein [Mucilaginibacter daejeonensis]|uniref:DUF5071 domain-containing protein n=1 Tax=Mucilaginibacter daejeonensis TaxID=398049 RepID=UPI001D170BE3|nr:DUF5071 domain-containing protein [Mucilaginibacter daejeonensis]UEG54501.1 DUF5071 domain-containing protein [Mucilaginibacter daejeonensis]